METSEQYNFKTTLKLISKCIKLAQTTLFLHLFSFIKYLLKSSDHTQSLMKQLDDPQTQPKSKSSPNFCTELWKIQTCIPVFCYLNSVINWKGKLCVRIGPHLLIGFETSNLSYNIHKKHSILHIALGIKVVPTCVLKHRFIHGELLCPVKRSIMLLL